MPTSGANAIGHVVIGIDTHKELHVAAAVDVVGGLQGTLTIANDRRGFEQLTEWAVEFGQVAAWAVEGTGSYGKRLARHLLDLGCRVIEVNRPNRQDRRLRGKSDAIDAENAARQVIAGYADAVAKSGDGVVESLRLLKIAYDGAVKARSRAMTTIRQVLVGVDDDLRGRTRSLGPRPLTHLLSRLRPGDPVAPEAAARVTLKSLARRWIALDEEAAALAAQIDRLLHEHFPDLLEGFGIGPDSAAVILVSVGDNFDRLTSEAALARLAGACPIPAGSGQTDGRHRLNRGGDRRLNAALYRIVLTRMRYHQPTKDYVDRRTAEGKTKREIIRCLKRFVIREIYKLLQKVRRDTPVLT